MYYILIIAVVIIDQASKYIVKTYMALHESISVIENIFHITYIHNYGAAFSILEGQRWLLLVVTGIALLIFLVYMIVKKDSLHNVLKISMALIIAGGVGNLIDRAFYGYVVDFFDFRIWPIFNIADIAVCIGCALLIVYVLFIDRKEGKKALKDNDGSK